MGSTRLHRALRRPGCWVTEISSGRSWASPDFPNKELLAPNPTRPLGAVAWYTTDPRKAAVVYGLGGEGPLLMSAQHFDARH